MSKGPDWKRAMLNEAEASGNAAWAQETRQEARREQHIGTSVLLVTFAAAAGFGSMYASYPAWQTALLALAVVVFFAQGTEYRKWTFLPLLLLAHLLLLALIFAHQSGLGLAGVAYALVPLVAGWWADKKLDAMEVEA